MPREFLKPKRRREPKGKAKRQPEQALNRMVPARRVMNRVVRQCAPFKEECWPEPTYVHD